MEITTAAEQDVVAESLLGDPQEATQENGAEEVAQPEATEPEQVEAQPAEEEVTEELADDWLPSEQEKVFSDDTLRQYAERRYPEILQMLDKDPTNGALRQLLHDKLNTDIFLRQQQEQQIEPEVFEPEPEPEPTPQQVQPQLTREQYFQNLDNIIRQSTDPQIAKEFHDGFLRAFGVPEAEIAKTTPQQQMALTSHLSKFALNLVNTFVPQLVQQQFQPVLNQTFPGFSEMYERSAYAMAWDRVRNSNPAYASLPAYGSKEFARTLKDAESKFPEMIRAFEVDGKIPVDRAGNAYALLARIASGQTVDPAIVQRAAQAGARNARRADVRRSAANLGSGQSKAATQRTSSQFRTNDDIFDAETMDLYQREHGRL